jgi:hypothetical protein
MVFVNFGYPNGGMPGNVLLAFAPEEFNSHSPAVCRQS